MTAGDEGWVRPDPRARGGRHRARARRGERDGVLASWALALLLGCAACGMPSAVPVRPLAQQQELALPPVLPQPPVTALPLAVAGPSIAPVTVPLTPARPAADGALTSAEFTSGLPDDRAAVAVRTAMAQIGLPYQWGGNGPAAGDEGFDCSGLTTFAYAAAGITLPRTAATQYARGPHVAPDAALQPGDLVFYGAPGAVHHVGMYIGDGKMVNAPTFGRPVQTAYYRWSGDDYLGATRPAATGATTPGLLPSAPPEGAPSTHRPPPAVFEAPPAPPPTEVPVPSTSLPPEPVTAAAAVAATSPSGTATTTGSSASALTTSPAGGAAPSSAPDTSTTAPGAGSPPDSATNPGAPNPVTADPGGGPPGGQANPGGTTPAAPPTTAPPTATPPTATPSSTTPPTTPTTALPPAAATATGAGTPTSSTEAPRAATHLVVGGTTVALVPVPAPAAGGVPAPPATGGRIVEDDGRTVVVLAAPETLTGLAPGATLTIRGIDGSVRTWTVRAVGAREAAVLGPDLVAAGGLLVVAGAVGAAGAAGVAGAAAALVVVAT
ncbi:C40 family peptidase [Pseudonocardia dioxanivorans]|uniref:C40 family peptidase n=1 Tax=Pseudonocardia dioxanivorans TaxID=240495 RepID=UPI002D768EA1|nr:C40 family peptidase [Pseudonocardia dioxanivorans]